MFLQIRDLTKLFCENNGVKDINFSVEEGEFITLLGPSGCGKTTLLNLLGGLLFPDAGEIILEGARIDTIAPEKRPLSTVFQSYALFTHYNVLDNVAYGLKYFRKLSTKEARKEAEKFIEAVGLTGFENYPIHKLSGGQQQRVALARGLATNPRILLLDEPLSNLDANLRVRMRQEIKEIQERYGITMIFVTHDQDEALAMSDRIVVMDRARVVQIGTPKEIYQHPSNRYVAEFVGRSNFFTEGKNTYMVRPENIRIVKDSLGKYLIRSQIFLGSHTLIQASDGEKMIDIHISGEREDPLETGERVSLELLKKIPIGQ